ncbi:MAG: serine/threonine protein kinase [bacterium]|nr:MAG: serine/threonine protein kinase [bacterium]
MKIEGYTIQSEISRGPITSAFLANQDNLDRRVLLKVLNAQWRNETDLVERFRREAKISARLKHPNIVTIFDFGISNQAFYIAMEYVEGQMLSNFIRQHHPLPFSLVIYILREILQGLAYAHRKEVLHRDIKPDNILVGNDGNLKISDFGLATIAEFPRLTNQDDVVGTPAYMSPEQARGLKLDHRSDLFSLGVTLYDVITGKSPFLDKNLALTINNILTRVPSSPVQYRKDIPAWLEQLTLQLVDKDISKRPESVQTILDQYHDELKNVEHADLKPFFTDLHAQSTYRFGKIPDIARKPELTKKRKFLFIGIPVFIIIAVAYFIIQFLPDGNSPEQHQSAILPVDTTETNDIKESGSFSFENSARNDSASDQVKSPKNPPITKPPLLKLPEKSDREAKSLASQEASTPEKTTENMIIENTEGKLYIACHPWADVLIDGEYIETTPILQPILLSTGIHKIELRNPTYFTYQENIKIESGRTDTLFVRLEPAMGYLNIQAIPWGKIHIDDQYLETTPLSEPLSILAGKHQIRITNPNFNDITDSIWIEPGKTTEKVFYFRP